MNILHLAPFLQGGAGRVIADLAIAQLRMGHRVTVVASETGAPGYGNYPGHLAKLESAKVPVHLADSLFFRDSVQNLQVVDLIADRLWSIGRPDVIHTHAAVPSMIGLLLAGSLRRSTPVVQTMHGWGRAKTPEQADADVRILNLVTHVAVPSQQSFEQLVYLGVDPSRIALVPYGVDPEPPSALEGPDAELAARIKAWRARGALVVCVVGTVGERKNQALLVEAMGRVSTPDIYAVFIGDGDLETLREQVSSAGLTERIVVHGYSAAARQLAAACDALVLPSRSEGQPLAILEAFCDRLLVIASDIPELAELVSDGETGLLFAKEDPTSLAQALDQVRRTHPTERILIAVRAYGRYRREFACSRMLRAYLDEYAAASDTSGTLQRG